MDSVGGVECEFVAKRNRNRERLRLVCFLSRVRAQTFCRIRKICRKKPEIGNSELSTDEEHDSA